jgi:hypothetical protein
LALEEVNKRIRAFEEEKARLQAESEGTGVKALAAKNMLAQIESSPVKSELNKVSIIHTYCKALNNSNTVAPFFNTIIHSTTTMFDRLI